MAGGAQELALLLSARDAASSVVRGLERALGSLDKQTKATGANGADMGALLKSSGLAGAVGFGSLTAAAMAAGAAVGTALGTAAAAAGTFEKTMSGVKAVSGASMAEMKQLSALALKLGADTSFSASQAGKGIEELTKAGLSVGQIMGGAATAALNLAAAGEIELAQAAEIAANAMNQFNIPASGLAHVSDQIAGAANASSLSVNDFALSLQQVGTVAATAGQSFDSTAQAIAVMGAQGLKSSDAGTSLKTMLLALQPSTKEAGEMMRTLGLMTKDGTSAFFDQAGKAKSLRDVAAALHSSLSGLTERQRLFALETMFGSDAMRAAAVLARDGGAAFDRMAEGMGKVTAADVAKIRLDNLAGDVERLHGAAETASINLGKMITPELRSAVQELEKAVDNRLNPALERLNRLVGESGQKSMEAKEGAEQFSAALSGVGIAALRAVPGLGFFVDMAQQAAGALNLALPDVNAGKKLVAPYEDAAAAQKRILDNIRSANEAFHNEALEASVSTHLGAIGATAEKVDPQIAALRAQIDALMRKQQGLAGATKEAKSALQELGGSFEDVRKAGELLKLEQSAIDAMILKMGGTVLDTGEIVDGFGKTVNRLTAIFGLAVPNAGAFVAQLQEVIAATKAAEEAEKAAIKAKQEAEEATRELEQAQSALTSAQSAQISETERQQAAFQKLADTVMGPVKGAFDLLFSTLNGGFGAGTTSALGATLGTLLSAGGKAATRAAGVHIPHYAGGTDNHPGGLALVGERGPEVVNLPGGSSVTPNGKYRTLSTGASGSGPDLSAIKAATQAAEAATAALKAATDAIEQQHRDLTEKYAGGWQVVNDRLDTARQNLVGVALAMKQGEESAGGAARMLTMGAEAMAALQNTGEDTTNALGLVHNSLDSLSGSLGKLSGPDLAAAGALMDAMRGLETDFRAGKISAEQFQAGIDKLSPGLKALTDKADAAAQKVKALKDAHVDAMASFLENNPLATLGSAEAQVAKQEWIVSLRKGLRDALAAGLDPTEHLKALREATAKTLAELNAEAVAGMAKDTAARAAEIASGAVANFKAQIERQGGTDFSVGETMAEATRRWEAAHAEARRIGDNLIAVANTQAQAFATAAARTAEAQKSMASSAAALGPTAADLKRAAEAGLRVDVLLDQFNRQLNFALARGQMARSFHDLLNSQLIAEDPNAANFVEGGQGGPTSEQQRNSGEENAYALGGVVTGPVGRPQRAIVHGGEYVLKPGQKDNIEALLSAILGALQSGLTIDGRRAAALLSPHLLASGDDAGRLGGGMGY